MAEIHAAVTLAVGCAERSPQSSATMRANDVVTSRNTNANERRRPREFDDAALKSLPARLRCVARKMNCTGASIRQQRVSREDGQHQCRTLYVANRRANTIVRALGSEC